MIFYNMQNADITVKTTLVDLMRPCRAENVILNVYTWVFSEMLRTYPAEDIYLWITRGREPLPNDLHSRRNDYIDERRLMYWYWNGLCSYNYGAPQPRIPDGDSTQKISENIMTHLRALPFHSAVATWIGASIDYLRICSYQWYLDLARRDRSIRIWKSGEERNIPQYLASIEALSHF